MLARAGLPVGLRTLAGLLAAAGVLLCWHVDQPVQLYASLALAILPGIVLLGVWKHAHWRQIHREQPQQDGTEMAGLHLRTIEALALAIDAKDATTHEHLRRVQVYCTEIGKDLGMDQSELLALRAAALLHDIGKLAVPEYIISKPGRLTVEEFEKIKIHPIVGAEILECVRFPYPVVPIVRAHHEKWDGSGYPFGLQGKQIPLGARILCVVDCLDALTSDRPYRAALSLDEVIQRIARESGRSFDPQVVEVLRRRYRDLDQLARQHSARAQRLSARARIPPGSAPGAGLEPAPGPDGETTEPLDFVLRIAAARQEFHLLHEITRDLGNSLSLDDTLSVLDARLRGLIPHQAIAIRLLNDGLLQQSFISGEKAPLIAPVAIPAGQGLSGWVALNRRPVVNGDPALEPGCFYRPGLPGALRSALSVPLEGPSGVVGTLTLYHTVPYAFTPDHLRILLAISAKAGLTIENALQYHQAQECAVTDELTGLLNTRPLYAHLQRELSRSERNGAGLALLVLDLNGFKQVNDRFGHQQGNRVLQLVADGLRSISRVYDCVARIGGDEFVVVMPEIGREALQAKIDAIAQMVVEVGRGTCGQEALSVSVGEAYYPEDGGDAQQLLAVADRRMYQVKQWHHAEHNPPWCAGEVLAEPAAVEQDKEVALVFG